MSVYLKLMSVQSELKAPKSQTNTFGKYKYRSCEDILEGVKPLLAKYKALIIIKDDIDHIDGRYYVRAIVTFIDAETGEKVEVYSNAREPENKKGMDESQITGAASSYARKYALNGLLAIDDTKDDDATNEGYKKPNTPNTTKPVSKPQQTKPSEPKRDLGKECRDNIIELYGKENYVGKLQELTEFKGKDGNLVAGLKSLTGVSEKRIQVLHGKLKKLKEDKETFGTVGNEENLEDQCSEHPDYIGGIG